MLMRALEYDRLIEDPEWIYRWNGHEWGAQGISHFYREGMFVSPTRLVMDHILDRLAIEPELRHAWCESHANEVIESEFRGEFSRHTPGFFRRRVLRLRIGTIWDHGRYRRLDEWRG
jgi:hypothetical protein